jgi:hypothetical protein
MLSKVAGLAKAEMSKAAAIFQTLQGRFLGLLDAYRDKLPAAEAAQEVPAESTDAPTEAAAEPSTEAPATEAPAETPEASAPSDAEPTTTDAETTTDTPSDTDTGTTEQEPAQPEGEE